MAPLEPLNPVKLAFGSILLLHALVCLCVITPIYYRRRNSVYFRYRTPGLMNITNLYGCYMMVIMCLQEILLSSGQSHFQCGWLWFGDMLYVPVFSMCLQARAWALVVRFTPALRTTWKRRYLDAKTWCYMVGAAAIIIVPIYIGFAIMSPQYFSSDGDRFCAGNREWQFFMAYSGIALVFNRGLQSCMKDVDDAYQIAPELRHGFVQMSLMFLYYHIPQAVAEYCFDRQAFERQYFPLDYLLYMFHACFFHSIATRTLYGHRLWKRKNGIRDGSQTRTSQHESSTTANSLTTQHWAHSTQGVGLESLKSQHQQPRSRLATYNSGTAAVTPAVSPATAARVHLHHGHRPNGPLTLHYVLNDDELFEAFGAHATKSLCFEMVEFWTEQREFRLKNAEARALLGLKARHKAPAAPVIQHGAMLAAPRGSDPFADQSPLANSRRMTVPITSSHDDELVQVERRSSAGLLSSTASTGLSIVGTPIFTASSRSAAVQPADITMSHSPTASTTHLPSQQQHQLSVASLFTPPQNARTIPLRHATVHPIAHSKPQASNDHFGVTDTEVIEFCCHVYQKYVRTGSDFELNIHDVLRKEYRVAVAAAEQQKSTAASKPPKKSLFQLRTASNAGTAVHDLEVQRTVAPADSNDEPLVDTLWHVFNRVQKEIYRLMETNLYKSFQNTEAYQSRLAKSQATIAIVEAIG